MTRIFVTTGPYPPEIGGPATYTKLLEETLPSRGFEVEVLAFREVRHLPKVVRHLAFAWKVLWKGKRADIIFAQDTMSVGLPTAVANIFLRKPFFVRVPGDHVWEQGQQRFGVTERLDDFPVFSPEWPRTLRIMRKLQFWVVRSATEVVVPSNYFCRIVSSWGVSVERIQTIYNGIRPLSVPAGTSVQPKQLVSIGRLVPWKGFAGLITLLRDMPEWQLVIVGDGPDRAKLEQHADTTGVAARVTFAGSVVREEMARLVASSRAFVLNTSFESFSFQTVEAMQLGTPVVATHVGSLPELITDGAEGILLEPDNLAAFKEVLLRLEVDDELRARIIAAAQKKAQTFSIERTVDALVVSFKKSL